MIQRLTGMRLNWVNSMLIMRLVPTTWLKSLSRFLKRDWLIN